MLSLVAKKMARLPCLPTLVARPRSVHLTALLAQKKGKKDGRNMKPCPASKEPDCHVLNKRSCSPTKPMRPCNETAEDCNQPTYPCCKSTRIAESPCTASGKASEFKKRRSPFQSMWESYEGKTYARPEVLWHYPEDCCPPCEDVRFDVLYYTPSNKCRGYQRTWWECCPRMVPKRVCSYCDAVPPQVLRRCLPICPQSACTQGHEKERLDCLNKNSKGCTRLRMPCCRTSRVPPSCKIFPHPSECEKIKCPFPSYSECLQEDPAVLPERPPECLCKNVQPLCIQLRRAKHMSKHNLSLYPCSPGTF